MNEIAALLSYEERLYLQKFNGALYLGGFAPACSLAPPDGLLEKGLVRERVFGRTWAPSELGELVVAAVLEVSRAQTFYGR